MWQPAVLLLVLGCVSAQNYRVCIPATDRTLCNNLDRDGSQAICEPVESRIDCAIKLARGTADIGVFNEEETLLLGQQQPNDNTVVATIRDVSRTELYAFEAVAIVANNHSGGLAGLKSANYCHPGFDQADERWSPRVLKAFEQAVVGTDRCPSDPPPGKTVEELETQQINEFFSSACRPGSWSYNSSIDASLKAEFPNLCALCGTATACAGYNLNSLVDTVVSGVTTNNRHIQALECLRTNQNSVAYVAWRHVQEFFNIRLDVATSYAVLCPDGTTRALTSEILNNAISPCAFVRQPWSTVVTNSQNAAAILANLRTWWPNGTNPGGSTWQAVLYNGILGGSNARVVFETTPISPLNYTSTIRPIPAVDTTASCLPARRWCTLSTAEHTKCQWVRAAAYSLGVQPAISCQQRAQIFECLADIKENRVDFLASASNYGYLARQHYQLSPVKLIQNSRSAANGFSRVAAFVKETHAQSNVTRFENLKGKTACFPEYGGIAFVAFVRVAQESGVISASECDYTRAAGDLFDTACAPGALDASHALSTSSYNASHLCSACKPAIGIVGNFSEATTCAWDYSNRYFGNNGSLLCLAEPDTHIAVLQTQNIQAHITALGLDANQFRALCRNNTLAATTGVNIDDGCLLAHVVDAEVITRRADPLNNALSVLLETLDMFFGYNAESHAQLINLEIFSPFDGTSDLLFKDSAIGFTEPSIASSNSEARNYIELFTHLETCTGNSASGFSGKNVYAAAMTVFMAMVARFVVY